jgi:hypothetical protein
MICLGRTRRNRQSRTTGRIDMLLETGNHENPTPSSTDVRRLRDLEGREVSLALVDGSRLDGVTLVSAGRGGTTSVWVYAGGMDVFVPRTRVIDAWEAAPPTAA